MDPFDYLYKAACSGLWVTPSDERIFYAWLYTLLSYECVDTSEGFIREFIEAYK